MWKTSKNSKRDKKKMREYKKGLTKFRRCRAQTRVLCYAYANEMNESNVSSDEHEYATECVCCVLMSNVSKRCAVVEYESTLSTYNQLHAASLPLLPKEGKCSFFQCVSLKTHTHIGIHTHTHAARENILPATFSVSRVKSTHTTQCQCICVRTSNIFHGDLFIYFYLLILMHLFWNNFVRNHFCHVKLMFDKNFIKF